MTRWLVTGAGGMLGQDVIGLLREQGDDVGGLDHAELDVTDAKGTRDAVSDSKADIVVNCAAWTAVDDAESHEDLAMAVNADGAANLAMACAKSGSTLVHISTDYVFGGSAAEPYAEDAEPAPRTAYGRTKLAGEQAVRRLLPDGSYVLRTAWLYGARGPNFVRTMIRLEAGRDTVAVVDDQHGQPTWTGDVALQIARVAQSAAAPGIYHATSAGATTWLGLARAVFELLGADPARVTRTSSSEFARRAQRPAYSVLAHGRWSAAGLPSLPDWEHSLRRAFPEIAAAEGR
jgi:dTDP-4-dehydrorhamnose reductase